MLSFAYAMVGHVMDEATFLVVPGSLISWCVMSHGRLAPYYLDDMDSKLDGWLQCCGSGSASGSASGSQSGWRPYCCRQDSCCPASQVKKTKVRPDYSSAPTQLALCLRLAYWSKRRELLRAVTLNDSTQQRRISELRVWSEVCEFVRIKNKKPFTE